VTDPTFKYGYGISVPVIDGKPQCLDGSGDMVEIERVIADDIRRAVDRMYDDLLFTGNAFTGLQQDPIPESDTQASGTYFAETPRCSPYGEPPHE